MSFKSVQFNFNRSLLHHWLQPHILGCEKDYLEIEPDDLVCYVLHSKSIADLLVLEQACIDANLPLPTSALATIEARSFFFLGRAEGTLGRKTQRQQSARMLRLLAHQNDDGNSANKKNIKIVPVSLFWGHQPEKEKSIFKLILSENWTVTSRFKKLLAGIFHPKHILVQFSKPINLAELVASETDKEKQIRKLLRLLRTHFTRQKQAIIGPDLSHRRTLINSILGSDAVSNVIKAEVSENNKPRNQVEKLAFSYAQEIAADQSYRVVRFFFVLLTWLWNKLYDGINISHIETAKELAKSHEIIYIPCHRSHIDYLLLSYVLYSNGLTPPHIAAGKNLNLPIVGPLLRRGGAFFMRRSFKDNPLYKAVFDEYLNLMFNRGHSIEYFIEGGRSRTGRTLAPRTGMLSMTILSAQRSIAKPIVFLPVYFGYERILEASTYLGELSGKAKTEESLFDVFSIFRTFKHSFGQVSVNFGEPLLLENFLREHSSKWQENVSDATILFDASVNLADILATRINAAAAINPINLVATAILCTPKQTIEVHRLERQVQILQQLSSKLRPSIYTTVTKLKFDEVINHAQKVTGIERIETENFGDILQADARTASLLTYYANNSLHVFIFASLVARIVHHSKIISIQKLVKACTVCYPYLQAELFLCWSRDEIEIHCERILMELAALHLITVEDKKVKAPSATTDSYASLTDLAEIIEPSLERFHIVCALLQQDRIYTVSELENAAASIAQHLSTIYGINSPEFFDKPLFKRFIKSLENEKCITSTDEMIVIQKDFEKIKTNAKQFLNSHVIYNVDQAVQRLGINH